MNRIREMRIAREETQQQIAELLETTQQAYSKYEKGINEMPIWRIVKLCEHYHVSVDYILGLTENPEPPKACRNSITGRCGHRLLHPKT